MMATWQEAAESLLEGKPPAEVVGNTSGEGSLPSYWCGLLSAAFSRSLNISAMAGVLPVATRFYGKRFANGRCAGPVFSLYHHL